MGQRRSAREWERLIRELERSGETPASFAKARGIRPDTLKWWRWRLQSKGKAPARETKATVRARRQPKHVRLVAIKPVYDQESRERSIAPTPVWELLAPTGHTLRVYDLRGLAVLKVALAAVAGNRRR
jgi:transposase-like protein